MIAVMPSCIKVLIQICGEKYLFVAIKKTTPSRK
jgi:hypothetical protein